MLHVGLLQGCCTVAGHRLPRVASEGRAEGWADIRLLGPLELARSGRAVEVGGAQRRALLAVLALAPNRVVSVEEIVDALWGDNPPPSATRTVHSLVSRLRRALGAENPGQGAALVTREPGYVLVVDPAAVDLCRFAG